MTEAGARDARAPASEPPPSRLRRPARDLTQGSLLRSLLVLAMPLLASSLVGGVLFQLVDLKLVSALGEDATTAIVVTNQSVRQLFFMLVMGASFGAQGLIARSIGAGQRDAADHAAGQVVVLGALVSTVVALLGAAFPAQILASMNVSPAVLEVGTPYVRLALLLNSGLVFGVLFGAILNGAGDTTTPLFISLVQTAVSLVAEWCLMFGRLGFPALGIRGAAFGLAIGQGVGIALALAVLFSGRARVHLRRHHLRPDPALLGRIAALSWPPALQMIGGFLVTVFFLRTMGDFGENAQAAYSIGLRLGWWVRCSRFRSRARAPSWSGRTSDRGTCHVRGALCSSASVRTSRCSGPWALRSRSSARRSCKPSARTPRSSASAASSCSIRRAASSRGGSTSSSFGCSKVRAM